MKRRFRWLVTIRKDGHFHFRKSQKSLTHSQIWGYERMGVVGLGWRGVILDEDGVIQLCMTGRDIIPFTDLDAALMAAMML